MKNPVLEEKLQRIEQAEKDRILRAAKVLGKQKKRPNSRRDVISRMIGRMKQQEYARRRERRRPMFGSDTRRGALLRPTVRLERM